MPLLLLYGTGAGIISALVLLIAGASEEQVIADYARSDAYHQVCRTVGVWCG
jgi:protein tyrosine/serine phosphatase